MLGSIAFVETDGLSIRTVPDGPFVRLATGSRVHSPRFSPSGQWIAFHDGDNLYVAGAGGRPPLPLPAGECVWLPAEDVLAVATDGDLLFFAARNGWALPSLIRKGAGLPVFNSEATEFVLRGRRPPERHWTGRGTLARWPTLARLLRRRRARTPTGCV